MMKQEYREAYAMRKTPGYHTTRKGIIKYRDKRKRVFALSDVIRIMVRINNTTIEKDGVDGIVSQIIQWRAIYKIAYRNYVYALDREVKSNGRKISGIIEGQRDSVGAKQFEAFLKGFDAVVAIATAALGNVPVAGEILNAVSWLYGFVRENFPVL